MTSAAFVSRLRDLLSTVEATSVLSSADVRMRGLREQLEFACVAVPCEQALVALEVTSFGRLAILATSTQAGSADADLEFVATGTPLAHVLAGGDAIGMSLEPGDALLDFARPLITVDARSAIVAPLRLGRSPVGGVILLRAAESGDREVRLAQHLGEVLSLTVESFRTERVLLELFARALPDVLAPDLPSTFGARLEAMLDELRFDPAYHRRVRMAVVCGKIAARGEADASLVEGVLDRFEEHFRALERATPEPIA